MGWRHACALLCALWQAGSAQAHLMPPGQGGVRLLDDMAYVALSLPVAVFDGVDDNGDGLLSRAEVDAHRGTLGSQVSARLRVRDGELEGGVLFEDLLLGSAGEAGSRGDAELLVVRTYRWPAPVSDLRVGLRIFDRPATQGGSLLLRAVDRTRTETVMLNGRRESHRFFAGPWHAFASFASDGARHILEGGDHLLFLLTVLVAGAGWRYWLAVVTSFTIAHSITLACAAFGWLQAPPRVVETLIAASIVLLAVDNLVRKEGAARHRPALVFACGLLHGLGIASVLADAGLSESNRVSSLLGFNLGVEIGQLAFMAVALGMLALVRHMVAAPRHGAITAACSAVAGSVGAWWMVERAIG